MMKVKIFDLEDEKDLEKDINDFISEMTGEVIDIKYQVSIGVFSEEQIFCFSAMIIYTIIHLRIFLLQQLHNMYFHYGNTLRVLNFNLCTLNRRTSNKSQK